MIVVALLFDYHNKNYGTIQSITDDTTWIQPLILYQQDNTTFSYLINTPLYIKTPYSSRTSTALYLENHFTIGSSFTFLGSFARRQKRFACARNRCAAYNLLIEMRQCSLRLKIPITISPQFLN